MNLDEAIEQGLLAEWLHETYEALAPSFGYETRNDTKAFDRTTANGKLMAAVCQPILTALQDAKEEIGRLANENSCLQAGLTVANECLVNSNEAIKKSNKTLISLIARITELEKAVGEVVEQWDDCTKPGAAAEGCPDPDYVAACRKALAAKQPAN